MGRFPAPLLHTVKRFQKQNDKGVVTTNQWIKSSSTRMDIQMDAHKRYLGIYEAAVFKSKIKISGTVELQKSNVLNEKTTSYLFIPVKETRRIKNIDKIIINGVEKQKSARLHSNNDSVGFAIEITKLELTKTLSYQIELQVMGSNNLEFLPTAKNTEINIKSNWNSPSFIGDYLPDERTINSKGFSASWKINQLSKATSQSSHFIQKNNEHFGVRIIIPANTYQVNERTIKYSFLIFVLTFAGFFLTELFFKLRLHPFQYLLIGFSISTFYLLLLSLSEYLSFNLSFLISAVAIILLISGYCSVVLKQRKRGIYTGLLFSLLYCFIFVLVKAEEASLLMGSIGLLLILALVMYLTRKFNWYELKIEKEL